MTRALAEPKLRTRNFGDRCRCAYCVHSSPARGSLGGIWLFCDHPESFKRFVRYEQSCECARPEDLVPA